MQEHQKFGFLLTYVMEALEADPSRVFEIEDLKARGESEIPPLVEAGYLIRCAGTKGAATAFKATVEPMVGEIRALRHLKGSGAPKQLGPRLTYLGTWTMKAEVYSWFLALVTSTIQLRELMTEKAKRYLVGERVVIVTPRFAGPAAADNLGIPYPVELLTLGELGLVKVRDEEVRRRFLSKSLRGIPSEVEAEIKASDLKLRSTIEITGIVERKTLNVIYVDKIKIRMGDPLFILLLTLILQQFLEPGGRIDIDTLEATGVVTKDLKDRAVSTLRSLLSRAVRETKLLIEADRDGELRISVHKSFFRIDTAALMEHPNVKVRKLATELKKELEEKRA
jgi:hypothetical protein